MSILKVAAVAFALAGGALALSPTAAQAQGYGYGYGHHQGYYRPAPAYVPPHIARKQAQLSRRFVEKYGYVQPQPTYGYGRPSYYGHGYGRPRGYNYGW
jgi:hypothetical protein